MTTTPRVRPGVMDAPLYVPGEKPGADGRNVAILSANENPLGPSPHAIEAARKAAGTLHRYPDGGAVALREALGKAHGIDPARIICGAGSDELITMLTRAYAGPGDEVAYSRHGFAMYPITTLTVGATPVAAPESNLTADVDALLEAVSERTVLMFLANPNNPTGTYLPAAEVRRLAEGLPGHVVLALDAAYAEYVTEADYEDGRVLVDEFPNVVMLRTFSKIYGLSALRLGWAYAQRPVIDTLNRLRSPFNVNHVAQAAGIAAIADTGHIETSRAYNAEWLPWLRAGLQELGIAAPPSSGNFVLAGFDDAETCARALKHLDSNGVLARGIGAYHLPEYMRITVGTQAECRAVIDAFRSFRGRS